MVNIHTCNVHCFSRCKMVHIGLYAIRKTPPFKIKILRYKLTGALVFIYNSSLPVKVISNELTLKF